MCAMWYFSSGTGIPARLVLWSEMYVSHKSGDRVTLMCVCVLLAVIEQERVMTASVAQADVGPSPPASLKPKPLSESMFVRTVLNTEPPPVSVSDSVVLSLLC